MNVFSLRNSVYTKAATSALSVVFLAVPLAPLTAYAEVSEQSSSSATDSGVASTEVQSDSTTIQQSDDQHGPSATEAESSGADTSITSKGTDNKSSKKIEPETSASLLAGGGDPNYEDERKAFRVQTTLRPDQQAGSLRYSYPIQVPPGRGKLTPDLVLTYSSQPGGSSNQFGYGWSINIPSIERINRTGTDAMYSHDYFHSSLDGELASTSQNTYGARDEKGAFNRYSYSTSTNSWTVTDKYGTVYKFGTASSSRQDNAASSTQIYKWMLDEVRDSNNNYIEYTYFKDSNQIYPDQITYTGNGSTDGPFQVDFLREARTDAATSSQYGFTAKTKYRIYEIDTKTNGTWVRKYLLSYGTGDNGVRSLLSGVTERGQDDSGATFSLPTTTFSYQQSMKTWLATSTDWNAPSVFVDYNNSIDIGVRVADVNGDALPDIIRGFRNADASISWQNTWINTGNGWTASSTWNPPAYFIDRANFGTSGDSGARLVDVNGDGLIDIVRSYVNVDSSATGSTAWINNGNGWTSNATWSPPTYIANHAQSPNGDYGVRILDVNGDGLPDIVQGWRSSVGGSNQFVYLNNGNGWTLATSSLWTVPTYFVNYQTESSGDIGVRVADVNGDGLTDIVRAYRDISGNEVWNAWINTGTGWTSDSSWIPPTFFMNYQQGPDYGLRTFDANGDGLVDMVQSWRNSGGGENKNVWLNTGVGWAAADSNWTLPTLFTNYQYSSSGDYGVRIFDMDGDNMDDILQAVTPAGGSPSYNNYSNNSKRTDLLTNLTNRFGGSTSYNYKQTALYRSTSGSQLNPDLPLNIDTVSSEVLYDGLGTYATTTYTYENGTYYFNNEFDRKVGGFNKITSTDSNGNYQTDFFHVGNGSDSSRGLVSDARAKIGSRYRTEQYDSANNLYAKNITRWYQSDIGSGRAFVFASSTLEMQYDGDSTHRDKAKHIAFSTSTGNPIHSFEAGEVSGNDDGTYTNSITSDDASTTITYAASSTGYVAGLVAQEVTNDSGANKVRETKRYYDGLSLGSVSAGNETKTESWISGSSYASTTKTYDGVYGLATQQRDGNGNLTTYTLDGFNLYPATTTNALSQATGYTYDYSSGKIKNTFDPNSRLYVNAYDGFDRLVSVAGPDPLTGNLATTTDYTYTDSATAGNNSVRRISRLNAATSTSAYTYFDGLARQIQTRVQAEDANTFAVSDVVYDNRGLQRKQSLPYFSTGSNRTSRTTNELLYGNTAYDALQRVTSVSTAVGTTTNAYGDWTVTVTDPNWEVKDYVYDALGNLTSVVEHTSTTTYTTAYTWNRNNKLSKVTDALGNIRNFAYDGLGRRTSAEDLHASADGTFGNWTYTYDAAGNVTTKVDPKSQTVQFTYDALNRPATENYTGSAGTEISYSYDTCTNGVGKLCSAAMLQGATTTFTYQASGQIASTTKVIDGSTYTTGYSNDRKGNVVSITHPNDVRIVYHYNDAGLIEAIALWQNGVPSQIVTDVDYSPHGKPVYVVYGNNTESIYTYDASQIYRLTNINTDVIGLGGTQVEAELEAIFDATNTPVVTPELEVISELVTATTSPIDEIEPVAVLIESTDDAETATSSVDFVEVPVEALNSSVATSSATSTDELLIPTEVSIPEEIADTKDDPSDRVAWANRKAEQILRHDLSGMHVNPEFGLRFEIVHYDKIEGGLQIFARAWQKDEQLGFGADGTVEIERFRIFNPPILVPSGETEDVTVRDSVSTVNLYKVDPKGALLETLAHTIHLVAKDGSNIVSGKVGRTVSTFYPTIDGIPNRDIGNPGQVWSSFRSGSGTNVDNTSTTIDAWGFQAGTTANQFIFEERPVYVFDTAAIPDSDVVSSATFSLSGAGKQNSSSNWTGAEIDVVLVSANPASSTNLVASDYAIANFGTTSLASRFAYANWTNNAYNDFSLNSTGTSTISKTGYTALGTLMGAIFDNTDPGDGADNGYQYVRAYSANQTGTTNDPKFVVEHSAVNHAPGAPTSLLTEGQTNPSNVSDPTPEFTAVFNDSDATDVATSYRIEVATSTSWTSFVWDSGQTSMASTSVGTTSPEISYGGSTLSASTTYYWRIQFWDQVGAAGAWSTGTSTFVLSSTSSPSTAGGIQNIAYTYDAVGNITTITDTSATYLNKTLSLTYDDLHRLTIASTTAATSTPFKRTYSYSAIGNISYASDIGNYTYSQTGLANPHAPTQIANGTATTSYSYDNNGNVSNAGAWTYAWDYRNRLATSTNGTTNTYKYDYQDERISKTENGSTTVEPFDTYSVGGSTTTVNVFLGDRLIATRTSGSTTTTRYIYADLLNSVSAVADSSGAVVQQLDFYPYGSKRITQGTDVSDREFLGEIQDSATALNYLNARYYEGSRGQFLSQDPSFLAVGDGKRVEELTKMKLEDVLRDPQSLNAYAYARNNPVTKMDPDGKWWKEWAFGFGSQSTADFVNEVGQATQYLADHNQTWGYAVDNPVKAGLAVGVVSAATAIPATAAVAGITSIQTGVSAAYVGKMAVGSALYGYVAKNALDSLPDVVRSYSKFNIKDRETWKAPAVSTALMYGPSAFGEHVGATYDIYDSINHIVHDLGGGGGKKESGNANTKK